MNNYIKSLVLLVLLAILGFLIWLCFFSTYLKNNNISAPDSSENQINKDAESVGSAQNEKSQVGPWLDEIFVAEIDCGRGIDNGVDMPQPEIDCFFNNIISCSNSKIILGKEVGYSEDILLSIERQDNSCLIQAEWQDKLVTCSVGLPDEQKKKQSLEASQKDRFLTVFGFPIILGDKISKNDKNCTSSGVVK